MPIISLEWYVHKCVRTFLRPLFKKMRRLRLMAHSHILVVCLLSCWKSVSSNPLTPKMHNRSNREGNNPLFFMRLTGRQTFGTFGASHLPSILWANAWNSRAVCPMQTIFQTWEWGVVYIAAMTWLLCDCWSETLFEKGTFHTMVCSNPFSPPPAQAKPHKAWTRTQVRHRTIYSTSGCKPIFRSQVSHTCSWLPIALCIHRQRTSSLRAPFTSTSSLCSRGYRQLKIRTWSLAFLTLLPRWRSKDLPV